MGKYVLEDFVDLLDISSNGEKKLYDYTGNNKSNVFSDMGAWHGYYNPHCRSKDLFGGFVGPLIIAEEYGANLSDYISKIYLKDNYSGRIYDFSKCSLYEFKYYPGRVYQKYWIYDLSVTLELIFINERTALIKTSIENLSDNKIILDVRWNGRIHNEDSEGNNLNQRLEPSDLGVRVAFSNMRNNTTFLSSDEASFFINYNGNVCTEVNENEYESRVKESILIESKCNSVLFSSQSYVFTVDEYEAENKISTEAIQSGEIYFKRNLEIWQVYIDKTFLKDKMKIPFEYKKAVVKSIMTLITNWRSSAGAIKYGGVTPSISYKGFNGLWPWDSFKQAVALAYFNEDLARDNIRAIFNYQLKEGDTLRPNDEGALIDTIFYNKDQCRGGNGENWNERNSKPPLGTWAVWKVYEITKDREFLSEMYDDLISYHKWWYKNRDYNKNGICEYGAMVHTAHEILNNKGEVEVLADSVIEAAAWESGMDNAPRFDVEGYENEEGTKVLINKNYYGKTLSYSINQESVDLNSYLYYEKKLLSKISYILSKFKEGDKFTLEAENLALYIRENMYDANSGFFYDIKIKEEIHNSSTYSKGNFKAVKEKLDCDIEGNCVGEILRSRGKGCEGFIPLWAEVASNYQSKIVAKNILNEDMFNTFFPLPTVSKDNKRFSPTKYWRGPVWLDQAYFAIEGLSKYGYIEEGKLLAKKLFENGEGVLDNLPIRENYNPENGKGLHCKNFSWSAAVYYILYQEIL